jgi:hypothetical protein
MAATQVQTGFTATIEGRFYADGVLTDDGTPTIGVTKADGTVLVASGTATNSGGTGVRRYALPAQPEVNLLKATWTGATQTVVTWVEIIGDILFTLAALRAVKVAGGTPFASTTDFPTQTLLDRRAEVTDDFEQRCGWSFVPRFTREVINGGGRCELLLEQRNATKLLSVTINGVAQSLAGFTLDRAGIVYATTNFLPTGWFRWGVNNVVVEYVRGWDRPQAAISSAALARAAMLLLPSQAGSTVSSWTTPDGTTYSYDQAGQTFAGGGVRHYGVPGIDSVLNQYSATGAFA